MTTLGTPLLSTSADVTVEWCVWLCVGDGVCGVVCVVVWGVLWCKCRVCVVHVCVVKGVWRVDREGRGQGGEELSGTGLRVHGPCPRGTAAALGPLLTSEGRWGAGVRDESRGAFEGRKAIYAWSAGTVSAPNLRMCA